MTVIKVSSGSPEYSNLLLRQLPGMNPRWEDCEFFINSDVTECDWWFVLHGSGLIKTEECICDPNHIVYVSMEPTEKISKVSSLFMSQFSHLVLCDRDISHPNITYMNWLTWWVGIVVDKSKGDHFSKVHNLTYDDFVMMRPIEKINKISIIFSRKNFTIGHQNRINFIDTLINSPIGKYIDVYGDGYKHIPDKWNAIVQYKYHLVIENTSIKDYWSEKLADAFLGFSVPIYYGCPNIDNYFSEDAMIMIDIGEPELSIATIKSIIEENIYEEKVDAINIARNQILNEYNIFNLMRNMALNKASELKNVKLKTNYFFSDSFPKKIARYFLKKFNFKF